jgi:uncharacterized protein (TIGR02246 family)
MSVVVLGFLLAPSRAAAQAQPAALDASLTAFRDSWRDAWTRRDTKALAALMADDVDWIAADGTWLKGRKAWKEHHDKLFARQFQTARWKLLDERVQFLDSATAITITATQIEGDTRGDGSARAARQSVGTRVIARHGGKWLLKTAHNTIIQNAPPS